MVEELCFVDFAILDIVMVYVESKHAFPSGES